MLLSIHVLVGSLAILLGAVALGARKGGWVHRRSGQAFVVAMLLMGLTAGFLGLRNGWTDPNVFAGILTAYFVLTALMTVRTAFRFERAFNTAAFLIALSLASTTAFAGATMVGTPGLASGGVPNLIKGVMTLVIATVLLVAAVGDARVIRAGSLRGAPRLARHLWRMCFALFIAAASFFSIRERVAAVLPEPFTSGPARALPIVLLFAVMTYWLLKLRRGRRPRQVLQTIGVTNV